MFANFLIGLREGLEAALIVGILVAYVRKIGRNDLVPRILLGVGMAVGLSLVIGAVLTYGTSGLSDQLKETITGVLSLVAAGFVTWMVFWMARAARGLSGQLRGEIDSHLSGAGWGLVLVAFLAVAREGLETALFIWAAVQSSGSTALPLIGATLGILLATVLGYLIYRGVLSINLSAFFTATGAILIIVAAGVLAYGVHELQEAGVVPGGEVLAFDVSAAIPPDSWYGTLLKGTLNFSPATTWVAAIAWLAYVIPVMTVFLARSLRGRRAAAPAAA